MKHMLLFAASTAMALASCTCGDTIEVACQLDSDCAAGSHCAAGKCTGTGQGGGFVGQGGGSGGSGGSGGGSTIVTGCNPTATDNASRDTDCDGITDADEYTKDHGNGQHTDPCNSDTDGDGVPDGIEVGSMSSVVASCMYPGDKDPGSHTNPTVADTDGDTLSDGAEDKNHDGRVDPGESNPNKIDSDCDGISDADERSGRLGCPTDPLMVDSDGDGVPDGVEENVAPAGSDDAVCHYPAATFDSDPATKTNACAADTDMDGIGDGTEDGNKNGRVDTSELDPNNPADGAGPAGAACAIANLKPVIFQSSGFADVNVALAPTFTEVGRLLEGTTEKGIIFYDATTKVGGMAISLAPNGAGVSNDEIAGRALIASTGVITGPLTQTFTTWDTFPAVKATYDLGGNTDLKTRLNDIAKAFTNMTVTGTLAGTAGVNGPYKVQVEFVRRTAMRTIVLIAITPSTAITEQALFTTDDTAGGSAIAQFGDFTATTCEVFDAKAGGKVDFLWVVDDSGSMQTSQTAVGSVGSIFGTRLASAGLDWRVGGVTSSNRAAGYRPFTTDVTVMEKWFTLNDPLWFNINGSSTEVFFPPPQSYVQSNAVRADASLHVIALTDSRDQSNVSPATMTAFIQTFNTGGRTSMMHGIICPEGQQCGDGELVETPGKIQTVIRNTGGVIGDITVANTAGAAAQAQLENYINAILSAAIGGAGYPLQKAPISSTIKVAIETGGTRGTCNTADVPRSRSNGFDYDSVARKIAFFGNCLPSATGKKIAVSYRYWIENSPDANGDPCGAMCIAPLACDPGTKSCICPANCGNACTGATPTCNQSSCTCSGDIN